MQQVWSDMWGKRWYDRLTAAITTTQWHRQTDRQTDKQTDALCVLSDTLVLSCCPWNVAYFPACQTTPRLHHSRSKSYTQTAHVTYTLNDKNTVSTVSWRRRPAVPVQVHALWRTAYWTTAVSFKSLLLKITWDNIQQRGTVIPSLWWLLKCKVTHFGKKNQEFWVLHEWS